MPYKLFPFEDLPLGMQSTVSLPLFFENIKAFSNEKAGCFFGWLITLAKRGSVAYKCLTSLRKVSLSLCIPVGSSPHGLEWKMEMSSLSSTGVGTAGLAGKEYGFNRSHWTLRPGSSRAASSCRNCKTCSPYSSRRCRRHLHLPFQTMGRWSHGYTQRKGHLSWGHQVFIHYRSSLC